jgi:hypothetical protein
VSLKTNFKTQILRLDFTRRHARQTKEKLTFMSNPNANSDVPAFYGNSAAPVHAPYAESAGSIVGPASIPVHDTTQTPFAGGSLADVDGSFAQGDVQIVR